VTVASRLDALVREHGLDPLARDGLARLLDLLVDEEAPTTVHDPSAAVDVHLADSLTALALPEVKAARHIADLGAGAGLPGLALAVALPEAHVFLVESVRRKCGFLERARAALGLANAEVVCERAEAWGAGRGRCDVVVARALAALAVLCEYAAPLLRDDGVLVAWKGTVGADEARTGAGAATQLGLAPAAVLPVTPYSTSQHRALHVFRKVAPTPAGFPRRPGVAAKRPLGGAVVRRAPR